MTKEEKKLLLKDLCGRLSYGVIVNTPPMGDGHLCSINQTIFGNEYGVNIKVTERDFFNDDECDIKPYLRPMSDMTADEEEQWAEFLMPTSYFDYENNGLKAAVFWDELCNAINWLNEHHFDYRNLIGKGLALETQKGMYNVK